MRLGFPKIFRLSRARRDGIGLFFGAGLLVFCFENCGPSFSLLTTSESLSNGMPEGGGTSSLPNGPSAPLQAADFRSRCSAAGVVRCVGFDNMIDISGVVGDSTGVLPGSVNSATLDRAVEASGGASLRFTIPPNAGSDPSGSYFANFSDDLSVQFDGNQEFYVQWRQRFSPEFLGSFWRESDGSFSAPKQVIIGTGDQPGCSRTNLSNLESSPGVGKCAYSCSALETVVTRNYSFNYPIMYNSCTGSSTHPAYDGFIEPFGNYDFKMQNALPAPYCTYTRQANGTYGNCFEYVPDEWMTFQVRIRLGPRIDDEFKNSVVELWVARAGRASVKVIDWGNTAAGHPAYNLAAGNPAANARFGKVWLVPYMTRKSESQPNPQAMVWYDELIVSRNRIADPR